jgi:hypothetical protein
MIKIIEARYRGDFQVSLAFSDGAEGQLNGRTLLQRTGPLIDALRDEPFFRRVFVDAGALCWPNGLELSPTKLRETCVASETA